MSQGFTRCDDCIHILADLPSKQPACKAFPEGIPPEIFWTHIDHIKPIEGDHGIQFEPKADSLYLYDDNGKVIDLRKK
ncbi:MAG: hypothetical protein ACIAQZ_01655 [Sedimentisphaeraceae bacterium JB056]